MKEGPQAARQRGATMVELIIALPMFVLFIFVIAELSRMHEAKSLLDVAALSAARAGAIHGGDSGKMKSAAATAMAPLYVTDEASVADVTAAIAKSQADTALTHSVGSTGIMDSFNDAGGGIQQGIRIEILSPTAQMVKDFGVIRADAQGNASKAKVIPNDNLMYRSTQLINNVNVQDANLLKIKVTYLYETKMPLTRYFFTPLMNANLTAVLFGGESAGSTADAPTGTGWRVPLVAYATVRMQSDFKEASLSAGGGGTGGGGTGGGGTGGGSTGGGGTGGDNTGGDDTGGDGTGEGGTGGDNAGGGDDGTEPGNPPDTTCPG